MSLKKKDLKKFKFFNNLTFLPFIEKIILYGSRAREDAQERSDIDLAIECPNAKEKDWLKVLDIIENADTLLKIDCIRLDQLSKDNSLRKSILREGLMIFSRSENVSKKSH